MIKISIIIAYYKAIENLKIILKAFNIQSCKDFEIIIAEDDNNQQTLDFIEKVKTDLKFQLIHLQQPKDEGFKKLAMLNRAIKISNSEKIVFIDGDCIPHKHFVKQYNKSINENTFCIGRAVMFDKKISNKIINSGSLKHLKFFKYLFSKSKKIKEGIYFPYFKLSFKTRGIVGRNWGCYKKILLDLNGFDEDYKFAGIGEDRDIEWRLKSYNAKGISVKNKAIVYHLFHERWYSSEKERENFKLMKTKIEKNNYKCLNGIEKIDN